MNIIGITGGVGCGKSRVLAYLKEKYHAVVYEADEIARELQKPGHACYDGIVRTFGKEILSENREIDRAKLAEQVFGCPEALKRLNGLVHPAVKEEVINRIAKEEKKGTEIFVLEAALLLDDGYDRVCDEIWYIYAPENVRTERLAASRSYSLERIKKMMASQRAEESFRELCDCTIDNSRNFEETCSQLKNAVESLYCKK